MNRATKRMLAKQEAAAERERARSAPLGAGAGGGRRGRRGGEGRAPGEKREPRMKRWVRFIKEVRFELKKVAWPSRSEVVTYSTVVLLSVTVLTLFVFALDLGFGKLVLHVFG